MTQTQKAMVLFSGGQDSTTCLAHALARYERVETVGFDYGQNHRVELDCREVILQKITELALIGRHGWATTICLTCRPCRKLAARR